MPAQQAAGIENTKSGCFNSAPFLAIVTPILYCPISRLNSGLLRNSCDFIAECNCVFRYVAGLLVCLGGYGHES